VVVVLLLVGSAVLVTMAWQERLCAVIRILEGDFGGGGILFAALESWWKMQQK